MGLGLGAVWGWDSGLPAAASASPARVSDSPGSCGPGGPRNSPLPPHLKPSSGTGMPHLRSRVMQRCLRPSRIHALVTFWVAGFREGRGGFRCWRVLVSLGLPAAPPHCRPPPFPTPPKTQSRNNTTPISARLHAVGAPPPALRGGLYVGLQLPAQPGEIQEDVPRGPHHGAGAGDLAAGVDELWGGVKEGFGGVGGLIEPGGACRRSCSAG